MPEKIQIKFAKMVLGVNRSAVNSAVLAELGLLPLSMQALKLAVGYWHHVLQRNEQSNVKNAYIDSKCTNKGICKKTGHSRYVDFAYLDTTSYVEVIFHSQNFFSLFLCISTPSMSKMVNMKQRVSRGDFSCPRRIFYYICYCLCRSKSRRSHGRHTVCFGYVHVLAVLQTSSKQQ